MKKVDRMLESVETSEDGCISFESFIKAFQKEIVKKEDILMSGSKAI